MKFLIFDTETTGLMLPSSAPIEKQPRIIEFGGVVVEGGSVVSKVNWLVNPEEEISAEITKITGIKNEDLVDKPTFKELLPLLREVFGDCDMTVCHNAPFDLGMMKTELELCGCTDFPFPADAVCTAQEYTPLFGRRPTLKVLYERVMGVPLAQTHRASDDAMAVVEVLFKDNFFQNFE